MPKREKTVLVPYTPEQMFDLVADVEHYPEFVPGYREAKVDQRSGDILQTSQCIGLGVVNARFHSVATLNRPTCIQIRSMESPFDSLDVEWRFEPAEEGCRVVFRADARLGNGLAARLFQPWVDRLSELVPPAFVARARVLYGHREGPGPT